MKQKPSGLSKIEMPAGPNPSTQWNSTKHGNSVWGQPGILNDGILQRTHRTTHARIFFATAGFRP